MSGMNFHRPDSQRQWTHNTRHELRELVQTALARRLSSVNRHVQIDIDENCVLLTGVVKSYYQKQLAQETIRSIDGVQQIRNELQVISV